MKKLIISLLSFLARRKIRRLNPTIIGITGSFGKTSTKEAVQTVLAEKFNARANEGSFNSEFGLPLTVLRQKSGFKNPLRWLFILFNSFFEAFLVREHTRKLILEMGADKPGDIDALLKIVTPNIRIITAVGRIHLEKGQFKDEEAIFKEKRKLATRARNDDWVIFNADDNWLKKLKVKAKSFRYGVSAEADLRATEIESTLEGLKLVLHYKSDVLRAEFPIIGEHHIYILLPAIATGLISGMTLEECVEALQKFKLPNGRLNLIEGVKGSLIIDSSYNASPTAVKVALKTLKDLPAERRIAVLGNMNELGHFSKQEHAAIGEIVAEFTDLLVTVGENARMIASIAKEKGFNKKNIYSFNDAIEAGEKFKKKIKKGDLILVKGSQNKVYLERFIKNIMKEPEQAKELLVRQGPEWNKK